MNRQFKQYIFLSAAFAFVLAHIANADDLFDDSLFADPAPVEAIKTDTPAATEAEPAKTDALPEVSGGVENISTEEAKPPENPAISSPEPLPVQTDTSLGMDFSASAMPAMDLNPPAPPSLDMPQQSSMSSMEFGGTGNQSLGYSQRPSEQVVGKISNDVFREMAEMERENTALMLQLKREQLRSEIDALKTSNRQILFDEIERREKMTQARLEWELAQDLKRQEALERKQKAEIRQKQIEAALKREEDRRIQKMKDDEAARIKKEEEEKAEKARKQAELKKKYDTASMVNVNGWKPLMIAATRPAKIKRSASSRIPATLTSLGEDLLTKKKAGQALTVEIPVSENPDAVKQAEPASSLYSVTEIRGTSGTLIAKLISKKDNATFFAKKSTILPTGHTVINIDKDFVLVQIGDVTEMIGFPSAGLVASNASGNSIGGGGEESENRASRPGTTRRRRSAPAPIAQRRRGGPTLAGAALAK